MHILAPMGTSVKLGETSAELGGTPGKKDAADSNRAKMVIFAAEAVPWDAKASWRADPVRGMLLVPAMHLFHTFLFQMRNSGTGTSDARATYSPCPCCFSYCLFRRDDLELVQKRETGPCTGTIIRFELPIDAEH